MDDDSQDPAVGYTQARVWDSYLDGGLNTPLDRAAALACEQRLPGIGQLARDTRRFLTQVVATLRGQGIRQFLELGSGLPSAGHVHQLTEPGEVVVYVDSDPITVSQARLLLPDTAGVQIVRADLRDPAAVLAAPTVRGTLELTEPVGVLLLHVLHQVDDQALARILDGYRQGVPAGSALAISHLSKQLDGVVSRTGTEVVDLLAGWQLVPPGLSTPDRWPGPPAEESLAWCVVARAW